MQILRRDKRFPSLLHGYVVRFAIKSGVNTDGRIWPLISISEGVVFTWLFSNSFLVSI